MFVFATIIAFQLFLAFLLLLLVSVSVPITKSIFLFRLTADVGSDFLSTNAHGSVKFGLWGYCLSAIDFSVLAFEHSTTASCSDVHLGYTFDDTIASALHVSKYEHLISRVTTAALVIHPISAALSFLALVFSLLLFRAGSKHYVKRCTLACLVTASIAAVLGTIVFIVDAALIATIRHELAHITDNVLSLGWGSAVWLTLAAVMALWGAVITTSFALRRKLWRSRY
ncbi:hypothetical protein BDN72DRAFT_831120 [Pluteus cervinus]|uniref:Uncharacterized protein n=1 Tax=Pluteus cervinus TaxID=181527 RepID=A0ACD3BEL6_9AGAR|nr:hypothetical protein BDN72DRAFT_831120 [Pluteus cervinus]